MVNAGERVTMSGMREPVQVRAAVTAGSLRAFAVRIRDAAERELDVSARAVLLDAAASLVAAADEAGMAARTLEITRVVAEPKSVRLVA